MLKLSDVFTSGATLEWYEAVALVRDVIERQTERSREGGLVPELDQVQLSPDGHVIVLGGAAAEEPVRRMGQMLQAILHQTDPPVQLRLVGVQATAPIPAFGSLEEYSKALEFFERPGRRVILQALYARASLAVSDRAKAGHVPTLDEIAPLPVQKKPGAEAKVARPRSRRRVALVAASLVALLGGSIAAVKFAHTPSGASLWSRVSARTVETSDRLGRAVVSGVSVVTDRVGLGRLAPEGPSSVSEHPTPAKVRSDLQPRAHQVKPTPATDTPLRAFDLDMPGAEPLGILHTPHPDERSSQPAVDPPAIEVKHTADTTIYAPDSHGVSAPVAVRPQLPRQLPDDVDRDSLGRIEIIVSPAGSVESVKLLHPPRNVQDSMLLSVAKAWQFQPALKDGVPVRFRKIVWVAAQ